MLTDVKAKVSLCLNCNNISSVNSTVCPICDEPLHQRKHNSFQKTLALSIAALCFFIPANIFPIMKTDTVTTFENSTILDGIFYFYEHGEFFIGTVIFIASVFIPIWKLLTLFYLLYSVHAGSRWKLKEKNRLFKIIDVIGKWSMLDIFVIGLMITLVQFGELARVSTGFAAISFATMVILTMMATNSFDTRLLWDNENNKDSND
jgi:paraquat-inducible protein A